MPYGRIRAACAPIPGSGTPSPFGGFELPGTIALSWEGVAWSPALNLFVAVADSGATNRAMTSPDGKTWTARALSASLLWNKITWSPSLGIFCACSRNNSGTDLATSPDGIIWTLRSEPAVGGTTNWFDIAWNETLGLFAIVGGNAGIGIGLHIITSPDGINWTARNAPTDNAWNGVTDGLVGGQPGFVAVAGIGSGALTRVMTSIDGITWLTRANSNANHWNRVTYAPEINLFVATATGTVAVNDRIMTSPNGIDWTTRPNPANNALHGLTAVKWSPSLGIFLVCIGGITGITGRRFMFSEDGVTWNLLTSPADNDWADIAWSPALARFVIVSNNGTNPVAIMS